MKMKGGELMQHLDVEKASAPTDFLIAAAWNFFDALNNF